MAEEGDQVRFIHEECILQHESLQHATGTPEERCERIVRPGPIHLVRMRLQDLVDGEIAHVRERERGEQGYEIACTREVDGAEVSVGDSHAFRVWLRR